MFRVLFQSLTCCSKEDSALRERSDEISRGVDGWKMIAYVSMAVIFEYSVYGASAAYLLSDDKMEY